MPRPLLCFGSAFAARTSLLTPFPAPQRAPLRRPLRPAAVFRRPLRACAGPADAADAADAGEEEKVKVQFFGMPTEGDVKVPDTAPAVAPSFEKYVELPLFPLSVVLNPGATIPLHIFEMRYRLLFNRLNSGELDAFGMVYYDSEAEALAQVGCSAKLRRFEPLPDGSGRIMTTSQGQKRFRIVNILEEKPYTRALVEYFEDDAPESSEMSELSDLELDVWDAVQDVLRLSNKLYKKSIDLNAIIRELAPAAADAKETSEDVAGPEVPEGIKRMQDFSFAVSQILDMALDEQQVLLQSNSTLFRFRRQRKMLENARNYLAAQVTINEAGLKF